MVWVSEKAERPDSITEITIYNTRKPSDRHLAYRINKTNKIIEFFPQQGFSPKSITIEGFSDLPPEFSEKMARIKGGAVYYLNKMVKDKEISEFKIVRSGKNRFRKYGKKYKVQLNYDSLKYLSSSLASINHEKKLEKIYTSDLAFHKFYPRKFKKIDKSIRHIANKVINNIEDEIIPELTSNEINKIIQFVIQIVNRKHKDEGYDKKLFTQTKLKVDEVALNKIIEEFEKLLAKKTLETTWGDFLKRNIFILDSRYVSTIKELNLMLAKARKVDFGLVDYNNYLDIFEIKRATTKLLYKKPDRGNYYWHYDAVRAITQAEKYLYQAELKGASLPHDIKRETGIDTKIVRPRVILVMGSLSQLDSDNKLEDFKVLQSSLKNVEVIPYDELLYRLKILREKKIF